MASNGQSANFFSDLLAATGDEDVAYAFRRQHGRSVAVLCDALFRAGVIAATQFHIDPPEACDFCSNSIAVENWFVDGEGPGGAWGNYCSSCFLSSGRGVGWGMGQVYSRISVNGEPRFVCVGGDRPVPETGEDD